MKDLIVLVPCKDIEYSISGLLSRPKELNINSIDFKFVRLNKHDSEVYKTAHNWLRMWQKDYRFGIVIFDKEGCGAEKKGTDKIIQEVQDHLDSSGWQGRSAVIVIDPELEIWAFNRSLNFAKVLNWEKAKLKEWLIQAKWLTKENFKPTQPQKALKAALRQQGIPLSSANFYKIAQTIDFTACQDPAFNSFCRILQKWFPIK